MGKTSLMAKILDHAHKCGFATVRLSIQAAGSRVLSDYELLLKWICFNTARELGLNPSMEEHWDSIFGPSEKLQGLPCKISVAKDWFGTSSCIG
jgi:hypothetical protein